MRATTLSAFLLSTLIGAPAMAQTTVEESQPPRVQGEQLTRLPGLSAFDPAEASDESLGVTLRSVRIISSPGATSAADVPDEINIDAIIARYVGQPISLKGLFDLRNEIVRAYIDAGRAFVAGTIPPQEISNGSVDIIVTESVLEAKKVEGLVFSDEDYILSNISAQEGETVDTDQLIEDLNWLNLNPYRNLVVVAEPGKEFGGTVLTFRASETKPWTIYGGYNNHGTPATDENRLFAGFHVANLPAIDHQLSYQLTMSPDALHRLDQSYTATEQAAYLSHDGNYFIPLPWRHKLRTRAAHIQTRSNLTGGLVSDTDTLILSTEYAIPTPRMGDISSEIYGRYEYKNSDRQIFTGATLASDTEIDVHQFLLGVRGNARDSLGRTNFDLRLVHSPGGISGANNAASYAAFSGNVGADADYNYLFANVQRSTPVSDGVRFITEVTGQYANETLPSTEVLSIGGADTIRGYATSEASGDKGIILRNELHFDVTPKDTKNVTAADLFAFFDVGHVEDIASNTSSTFSSLGVGFNAVIDDHISFNTSLGWALEDGVTTQSGDVRLNFNISARF